MGGQWLGENAALKLGLHKAWLPRFWGEIKTPGAGQCDCLLLGNTRGLSTWDGSSLWVYGMFSDKHSLLGHLTPVVCF